MRFSERAGYRVPETSLQMESMDSRLRNRLWTNFIETFFFERFAFLDHNETHHLIFYNIWDDFLGVTLETMHLSTSANIEKLRRWYDSTEWHQVYDFVEYCAALSSASNTSEAWKKVKALSCAYIEAVNFTLEKERSAYRLIDSAIVAITEKHEISEIEKTQHSKESSGSREHIKSAIRLYSNRDNPDFRNCIKESISAVESEINRFNGRKSKNLSEALKLAKERGLDLHPAFESGVSKLYGWTSDQDGIRHAILEPHYGVGEAEARFMLVTCSAFVNYISSLGEKS